MLYYAKSNGKIFGPMGRSELLSLRNNGTLDTAAEWSDGQSDDWKPLTTFNADALPDESGATFLDALLALNRWALRLLTPLLLLGLPAISVTGKPHILCALLFVYTGMIIIAFVSRSISWVGGIAYGSVAAILLIFSTLLPTQSLDTFLTNAALNAPHDSTPRRSEPTIVIDDDPTLPNLPPLPFPAQPSTSYFNQYLKYSPTRFNEYGYAMANLRSTFTQTNETDTLPVERARGFAQSIAELPYEQYVDWNNLYETLRKKKGNCGTKSIALYDMMKRGGAKNVFWVVGICYRSPINDTPMAHAWIYWIKDGKHYVIETTAPGMFHDLDEIRKDVRLSEFYSNTWPRWGICEGRYYVFGR